MAFGSNNPLNLNPYLSGDVCIDIEDDIMSDAELNYEIALLNQDQHSISHNLEGLNLNESDENEQSYFFDRSPQIIDLSIHNRGPLRGSVIQSVASNVGLNDQHNAILSSEHHRSVIENASNVGLNNQRNAVFKSVHHGSVIQNKSNVTPKGQYNAFVGSALHGNIDNSGQLRRPVRQNLAPNLKPKDHCNTFVDHALHGNIHNSGQLRKPITPNLEAKDERNISKDQINGFHGSVIEENMYPAHSSSSEASYSFGKNNRTDTSRVLKNQNKGPRQRPYRAGNPQKRAYFRSKYNPHAKALDALATFNAKQVSAMIKENENMNRQNKWKYSNGKKN